MVSVGRKSFIALETVVGLTALALMIAGHAPLWAWGLFLYLFIKPNCSTVLWRNTVRRRLSEETER